MLPGCSYSKENFLLLNIPPVGKLQNQGTVFNAKCVWQIIVGIYYEQVGGGAITPLESRIKIDVILLLIVLSECSEE